jgi:ubiquitin-like-conjugating enzyme ATG10
MLDAPFRAYPLLTPEEFHEVCHHLDRRYCHATLGPLRRRWKLRVCTALNTAFSLGPEYSTYLQIVRPLDGELDDGDLSAYLGNFSFGGEGDGDGGGVEMEVEGDGDRDREMMEAEEADRVCNINQLKCVEKKKIPTDKQTRLFCHHRRRRS